MAKGVGERAGTGRTAAPALPAGKTPAKTPQLETNDPFAVALRPELQGHVDKLTAAEERYAHNTAVRRANGGGRSRNARMEAAHGLQAREVYRDALGAYLGALGVSELHVSWEVQEKQQRLQHFEARVLQHQIQLAEASGSNRLARWWFDGSRVRRIILGRGAIVVPAAAIGLGAGAVVAVVGLPVWAGVGAGLGVAFAGRQIGGRVVTSVNRHRAATANGRQALQARSQERIEQFAKQYHGTTITRQDLIKPEWQDISEVFELRTREEQAENARRLRAGRLLGSLAAGGGFLAGNLAVHSIQLANQASHVASQHVGAAQTVQAQHAPTPATPSTTPTQPPTPPVPPHPNVPPAPHGLGHMYPWNAATHWNQAHHVSSSPGSVWKTLRHAAQLYNHAHGTHFGYVRHANGTYWLQNGAHQLSSGQLASFNQFLWNMSPSAV